MRLSGLSFEQFSGHNRPVSRSVELYENHIEYNPLCRGKSAPEVLSTENDSAELRGFTSPSIIVKNDGKVTLMKTVSISPQNASQNFITFTECEDNPIEKKTPSVMSGTVLVDRIGALISIISATIVALFVNYVVIFTVFAFALFAVQCIVSVVVLIVVAVKYDSIRSVGTHRNPEKSRRIFLYFTL